MDYQKIYGHLIPLLAEHKLAEAIQWTETELKKIPPTGYHHIIDRNLDDLVPSLITWIDEFHSRVSKNMDVESIYCEMNGFTINPDLWYIDLFAFDQYGGLEDLEWLADWEDENSTMNESFTITGMEDIQKVYAFRDDESEAESRGSVLGDFLVILRLQELFMKAIAAAKSEKRVWSNIPILVTAHDWELIYQTA